LTAGLQPVLLPLRQSNEPQPKDLWFSESTLEQPDCLSNPNTRNNLSRAPENAQNRDHCLKGSYVGKEDMDEQVGRSGSRNVWRNPRRKMKMFDTEQMRKGKVKATKHVGLSVTVLEKIMEKVLQTRL
jgi:hypothetical protein